MKKWFENIGKTQIRHVLAVIIVLGSFSLLGLMQIKPIPAANKDSVNLTIGIVLGGALGGVCGFYFGSSKDKEDEKKL